MNLGTGAMRPGVARLLHALTRLLLLPGLAVAWLAARHGGGTPLALIATALGLLPAAAMPPLGRIAAGPAGQAGLLQHWGAGRAARVRLLWAPVLAAPVALGLGVAIAWLLLASWVPSLSALLHRPIGGIL